MKTVVTMWRYPRLILLAVLCAVIYAAVLAAFKTSWTLIPGGYGFRVGNMFPPVFGLLFGPAGAVGAAIGNLIGDVLGNDLSLRSVFGFAGNFLEGYVPYVLWTRLGPLSAGQEPSLRSGRPWLEYAVIVVIGSAAAATVIAWGVGLIGSGPLSASGPFGTRSASIAIHNIIASWAGGILLALVYGWIASRKLRWQDVMAPADVGRPVHASVGAVLLVVGGVGGLILGAFLLPAGLAVPVVAPFVLATVVGAVLF